MFEAKPLQSLKEHGATASSSGVALPVGATKRRKSDIVSSAILVFYMPDCLDVVFRCRCASLPCSMQPVFERDAIPLSPDTSLKIPISFSFVPRITPRPVKNCWALDNMIPARAELPLGCVLR